ncbi:MAG: hypothetical protein J1F23_05110 [Oscillospiraceae bacterium]|nr:hypothetical protein [Oscillospiraceae bacterium]
MKKFFMSAIVFTLLVSLLFPTVAFAADDSQPAEWQDITLSEQEIDDILSLNPNNDISTYASDLIAMYNIAISKSGSTLIIVGKTYGTYEVKKSGFKEVVIQQRKSINDSWSTYLKYTDLYIDASGYTLSKSITVPSGYQYRVTCVHYAKKSLLSTQKINNTSNTVMI